VADRDCDLPLAATSSSAQLSRTVVPDKKQMCTNVNLWSESMPFTKIRPQKVRLCRGQLLYDYGIDYALTMIRYDMVIKSTGNLEGKLSV